MKDYITLALVETTNGSTALCAAPAYRIREGDTVIAVKSDSRQDLCKVLASKIARVDECGFELRLDGRYHDVHDLPRIMAKARDIGDPFEDEPSLEDEDGPASE